MSLFKFLKPLSGRLPTAEETSLPENAVRSANNAVQNMEPAGGRKYTTTFTAEDRAKVGKYAAENGVAKAQRHFKLENGVVGRPQQIGTFLDDDQAEDPFLDIHYDSD